LASSDSGTHPEVDCVTSRPRRVAFTLFLCTAVILTASTGALCSDIPALKDLFAEKFLVGCALDRMYFLDDEIISKHFNAMTPGNAVKWEATQPRPGQFRFGDADTLVRYAEDNGMTVIGHTLVWHQQTPSWVFTDESGADPTRDELLVRMGEHMHTVVGRYKGRVRGWDVVNEAVDDSGILRYTPWRRIIGDDYIEWAFRFAHEADPDAELYYNDYSTTIPAKREAIDNLVKGLLEKGIRVDAIGMQGHWDIGSPVGRTIHFSLIERASRRERFGR
jgi:endo-1,4-beta-xylanase